jgi:hypothetical protein
MLIKKKPIVESNFFTYGVYGIPVKEPRPKEMKGSDAWLASNNILALSDNKQLVADFKRYYDESPNRPLKDITNEVINDNDWTRQNTCVLLNFTKGELKKNGNLCAVNVGSSGYMIIRPNGDDLSTVVFKTEPPEDEDTEIKKV